MTKVTTVLRTLIHSKLVLREPSTLTLALMMTLTANHVLTESTVTIQQEQALVVTAILVTTVMKIKQQFLPPVELNACQDLIASLALSSHLTALQELSIALLTQILS